jgi:Swiss Army Knife RNA repair-like protein
MHPDAVYRTRRGIVVRGHGETRLFAWAPVLEAALRPHPEVRIVLSTSWVRVLGYTQARERLPAALRNRVMGASWHSRMDQRAWEAMTRFEQIHGYVRRHALTRWLALDNDAMGWPGSMRRHLVLTDDDKGLSAAAVQSELAAKLEALAATPGGAAAPLV